MIEPYLAGDDRSTRESVDLRILTLIASLLLAATVSLTFGQVVLRYFFNNPQTWAEEVGRYLFIWITFLGAAVAFARDTHIRVDAVIALLGSKVARGGDLFRRLVEAAAVAMLLYSGILVAWKHRNASFYTMPDMPQVIFYLAVPVGSALALFYVMRGIMRWKA
nr:TRAP transporter small permease [Mesorhizobium sp.]